VVAALHERAEGRVAVLRALMLPAFALAGFCVAGITAYLQNGGKIEQAQ
jgi:hypothetical protein